MYDSAAPAAQASKKVEMETKTKTQKMHFLTDRESTTGSQFLFRG